MSVEKVEPINYRRYVNHFTASAVVVAMGHVLLIHHKRIGAWLPPGGHIQSSEMPHEAAVREVFEETGVDVNVLSEPIFETKRLDALFLPQPLCMHAVSAIEEGRELYHLDLAYLCEPAAKDPPLPSIRIAKEINDARWVHRAAIEELPLANNVIELITLATRKLGLDA